MVFDVDAADLGEEVIVTLLFAESFFISGQMDRFFILKLFISFIKIIIRYDNEFL